MKTDAEKLYKRFTQIKHKIDAAPRHRCGGCLGLFGHKADSLDHCEKRLQDIEDNVRMEQSLLAEKVPLMHRQS